MAMRTEKKTLKPSIVMAPTRAVNSPRSGSWIRSHSTAEATIAPPQVTSVNSA